MPAPVTIDGLAVMIIDLRDDIHEIRKQTTKTNGRVNELEVANRIRQALDQERAHQIARETEARASALALTTAQQAQTLATTTARRAEVLAASDRKWSRSQWGISTLIAFLGVVAGVVVSHV